MHKRACEMPSPQEISRVKTKLDSLQRKEQTLKEQYESLLAAERNAVTNACTPHAEALIQKAIGCNARVTVLELNLGGVGSLEVIMAYTLELADEKLQCTFQREWGSSGFTLRYMSSTHDITVSHSFTLALLCCETALKSVLLSEKPLAKLLRERGPRFFMLLAASVCTCGFSGAVADGCSFLLDTASIECDRVGIVPCEALVTKVKYGDRVAHIKSCTECTFYTASFNYYRTTQVFLPETAECEEFYNKKGDLQIVGTSDLVVDYTLEEALCCWPLLSLKRCTEKEVLGAIMGWYMVSDFVAHFPGYKALSDEDVKQILRL
jgi:hypothetical protein